METKGIVVDREYLQNQGYTKDTLNRIDNINGEVSSTELEKGSRYNEGKLKWSLIDFPSQEPMVRVMMYGMHKYSIFTDNEGNQIKGVDIPVEEANRRIKEGTLFLFSSGANNWKKGLNRTEILESAMRHLTALLGGEENDKESGLSHVGHLQCNCMFYNYFNKK